MEPTLTAAVLDVEPLLDVVPVPLVALEPGSGRVLHINAAARGEFPSEPALRVARGETLTNVQYDWDTGARLRTVLVSGTTVTLGGERHVALVSFEDVTELESGRRRAAVQADELEVMLDGIADAVTVQSPDLKVIYANQAARRLYELPHDDGSPSSRPRPTSATTTSSTTPAGSSTSRGCRDGSRSWAWRRSRSR